MAPDTLARARQTLKDLRRPLPRTYFLDLFMTAAVLYAALWGATAYPSAVSPLLASLVAGLALTRAVLFAHELSHQRDAIPGLRETWNLLIGVPFLFPSFLYEAMHREHHRLSVYRTERDPEHAPDASGLIGRIGAGQLGALLLPWLLVARWSVLTPAAILVPRWRPRIEGRCSALTSNAAYQAPPRRPWERFAELACFAWSWLLLAAAAGGRLPLRLALVAVVAVSIATSIAALRGEILHRFQTEGEGGTRARQVLDSVNLSAEGLVTRLLFPMGIGYHALHHLAPTLPYHALPQAHARLLLSLGRDSFYARATEPDLLRAAQSAWREAEPRSQGRATPLPRRARSGPGTPA